MITMMIQVLPWTIILTMLPWKIILEVIHHHHLQLCLLVDQAEDQDNMIGQDREIMTNQVLPWMIILKMITDIILEVILQHHLQLCHLVDQAEDQDNVIDQDQETMTNQMLPWEIIQEMIPGKIIPEVIHHQYLQIFLHEDQPADLNLMIGRDRETVIRQVLLDLRPTQTKRRRRTKDKEGKETSPIRW